MSTIRQVLRRNGLVAATAKRKPKHKRFERDVANDMWQIEATEVPLDDGTKGWGINLLDDHSRHLDAAVAGPGATGELSVRPTHPDSLELVP